MNVQPSGAHKRCNNNNCGQIAGQLQKKGQTVNQSALLKIALSKTYCGKIEKMRVTEVPERLKVKSVTVMARGPVCVLFEMSKTAVKR